MRHVRFILGLGLLVFGYAARLPGQQLGAPNITNSIVQSVGGITYFTYTSEVKECDRIVPGAIAISETFLFQTIDETTPDFCGCDFCVRAETHVSVFGALAPGDYYLQLRTSMQPTHPFYAKSFTVPASDVPTLQGSLETNHFNLAVAGISNVNYTVEGSVNLTNWTPVITNAGAPFVWSEAIAPATSQRFFRVRIAGQ